MSNLRMLALNSCGINGWDTLQRLEPFLGSLQELYVAHSIFPDLPRAHAEALYEAATGIASTPLPSPGGRASKVTLISFFNFGPFFPCCAIKCMQCADFLRYEFWIYQTVVWTTGARYRCSLPATAPICDPCLFSSPLAHPSQVTAFAEDLAIKLFAHCIALSYNHKNSPDNHWLL